MTINPRRWSTNRRIVAVGAAILIASLIVSLTSWYRAYCAHDHRWTCAKVRKTIEWDYASALDAGETASPELLRRVVSNLYAGDDDVIRLADEQSCQGAEIVGICREDGIYYVSMDERGYLSIQCSDPEHDTDYTDYLD